MYPVGKPITQNEGEQIRSAGCAWPIGKRRFIAPAEVAPALPVDLANEDFRENIVQVLVGMFAGLLALARGAIASLSVRTVGGEGSNWAGRASWK